MLKNKTKDISLYVIINVILLIVIAAVIFIFYLLYIDKNRNILQNINEQASIFVESIKAEKQNESEGNINTNTEVILPTILENNNIENNNNNKYYYNELNSAAKKIYDCMEENVENIKTGNYTIDLPNGIGNNLQTESGMQELNENFQSSLDALIMDRVDLFYLDISKISLKIKTVTYGKSVKNYLSITPGENGIYLEDEFKSKQDVDSAISQVSNIRNQLISTVNGNKYNKIKQVHNWLIDNIEYSTETGDNAYNIYGALIYKKSVCEGYAEAFKYIMDGLNIPCILVTGNATNSDGNTENHEWNYIQITDKWYGVDVTWDDPILLNGAKLNNSNRYKYFLKGEDTFSKNHFQNSKFSGTGMTFNYPSLEKNDY